METKEILAAMDLNENLFTGEHWERVGKDLLKALQISAEAFVRTNMPIAVNLTEDEVKGLLYAAVISSPELPVVPANADAEMLAMAAYICKVRAQGFALMSEAQKQKNASIALLEKNAKEFAVNLGGVLLNVAFGALATGVTKAAIGAVTQ
jgi:hypothetical protein